MPAKTGSGFRPDIQGLRAVAVGVVILDHLFGWPAGGYIGVDVFFVISGYLITSLMLREHERTGGISWTGFYRRRIKRIVPASTVCVLVTVVASYFLLRAVRFQEVVGDALWSLLLASNWHFAVTESSRTLPPSPLLTYLVVVRGGTVLPRVADPVDRRLRRDWWAGGDSHGVRK